MKRLMSCALATLGLGAFVAACGEPAPREVRQRTSSIISRVVEETARSLRDAREMQEVQDLVDALQTFVPGMDLDDAVANADNTFEMDAQQAAAKLDQMLATHVFNEDNVVDARGDSITFAIRGDVLCKALSAAVCVESPGGRTRDCGADPASVAQCVTRVDRLQIRIRSTLVDSDGVDLTLQVGGADVLNLRLREDSVTLEWDLDAVKKAAGHVATVTGEQVYLPTTMKGALAVTLTVHGPGDLSLRSAITRAIDVDMGKPGAPLALKAEARNPLAEVRFRGSVPSISVSVDWGAVDLLLPARKIWSQASGALSVSLKGLTASLTVDPQGATVKNVSLGQGASAIALNGKSLVQVELPSFDMELAPWQSHPRCVFESGLDLRVALSLGPVQQYVSRPIPAWALSETYALTLSGASPELSPMPRSLDAPRGGIQVLGGTLELRSHVQPASVTVPAGACLLWSEQASPGSHPLLGHFQSVPCGL